jgi:transposase-like protein
LIIDHERKGWIAETKEKIIEMTLNGSGIRDISRVLGVYTEMVISENQKKESFLQSVNTGLLERESSSLRAAMISTNS